MKSLSEVCTKAIGVQWDSLLYIDILPFILSQVKKLIHLDKSTSDLVSYCWILYVRKQDWWCTTWLVYCLCFVVCLWPCFSFKLMGVACALCWICCQHLLCICSNVMIQSGICPWHTLQIWIASGKKIRNCTSLFLWLIIKAKPRTFLICRGAIVPNESFQLKKVIHFYWNSHHPFLTLFQLSTPTNSLYIIQVCIF